MAAKFIVAFPGEWFLKAGRNPAMPIATGQVERATRFDDCEAAEAALKAARTLKRDAKRAARIVLAPESDAEARERGFLPPA
jgi:hypothetical protein